MGGCWKGSGRRVAALALVPVLLATGCAEPPPRRLTAADYLVRDTAGEALATPAPAAPTPQPAGDAPRGLAAAQEVLGRGPLGNNPPPVAPVRELRTAPGGEISFNYAGVDVREVARDVLGTGLGLNYAVDPRVQGTITAQTGPLPRDAVLPAFEQVLRTAGLALVGAEGLYRIVPLEDAARGGAVARSREGYGVRVIPLRSVPAAEVKGVLDPFVPAGGVLQADPRRNLLVVSGPSTALQGFAELVQELDVDWLASRSFGLYPLRVGDARQVAEELSVIVDDTSGDGALGGLVRVVPVARLNAVLVIASQPAQLRQVRAWIDRLDYGDDQVTPRIFEYYVQNSRAADLAAVLSELLSSGDVRTAGEETAPGTEAAQVGGDRASRGFSIQPEGSGGAQVDPASGTVDLPAGGNAAQNQRDTGPAATLAGDRDRRRTTSNLRAGLGSRGGAADGLELPPIRVVADTKTNALVILARPRDYPIVESIIKKLDIVPLQVLIEATIAEVTLNDALEYGVQFFLKAGANRFTLSNSDTGALNVPNVNPVFPGFNYTLSISDSVGVINLLSTVSDVNVVSSPQLLVLDHQTAALQVGDQVPVVTQSSQSVTNPDAPIVNSVQYRNTGVVLQVTPRVNPSGLVTLDIDQEVSDVVRTTTSSINSPTIAQRRIVSSVIVQDGETVALGGLIRQNQGDRRSGIPVLSELPLLGPLFRDTQRSTNRTELLVLLSPRVIRNQTDARALTEELRDRMRALRPLPVGTR